MSFCPVSKTLRHLKCVGNINFFCRVQKRRWVPVQLAGPLVLKNGRAVYKNMFFVESRKEVECQYIYQKHFFLYSTVKSHARLQKYIFREGRGGHGHQAHHQNLKQCRRAMYSMVKWKARDQYSVRYRFQNPQFTVKRLENLYSDTLFWQRIRYY